MVMRKAKEKSSGFAYLAFRLPADVAAVVQSKAMDLSGASFFCGRQAECAAVFKSIVQIKPAVFELKSPYKETSSRRCTLMCAPTWASALRRRSRLRWCDTRTGI